jgi:hypothetical protein
MIKFVVVLAIIIVIAAMLRVFFAGGKRKHDSTLPRKSRHTPALHHESSQAQQLEKLRSSDQFWGVKMYPGSCEAAANELSDKEFTFDEAPDLPLEGCTAHQCNCRLIGISDKRRTDRRVKKEQRKKLRYDPSNPDRRSGKDRRRAGKAWLYNKGGHD